MFGLNSRNIRGGMILPTGSRPFFPLALLLYSTIRVSWYERFSYSVYPAWRGCMQLLGIADTLIARSRPIFPPPLRIFETPSSFKRVVPFFFCCRFFAFFFILGFSIHTDEHATNRTLCFCAFYTWLDIAGVC